VEYLPAAQFWQLASLGEAEAVEYLPAAQEVQAVAPWEE
jgi:hypothetical protein